MVWVTVSYQSCCCCWPHRTSPSLAAKNIINQILVLTIWWSPYVHLSCVVGKGCLLWPVHCLGKALLAFVLLCVVLQGYTCLLLQISLDFLLLHPREYISLLIIYWESIFHYWLFTERLYFTINYLLKSPQSLKDLLGYLVHGYIFGLNSCKRYHFGLLSLFSWSLFYVLSKRCCKRISHDFSWFIHLPQIASCDSWTVVMTTLVLNFGLFSLVCI